MVIKKVYKAAVISSVFI